MNGKSQRLGKSDTSSISHQESILCVFAAGSHSRRLSRKHLRRRGVVLVWVALVSLVMILLVGLSIDTAKVALNIHQMQNASDAAALAGAPTVRVDRAGARLQAQAIAGQNFADGTVVQLDLNETNDPNGDIVIGWYNRGEQTFTPSGDADAANAMAIVTTRNQERLDAGGPVGLLFGPIAGVSGVNIAGTWQGKGRPYAIAMTFGGTGAGLIALRPDDTGLYMNGNFTLNVLPVPPALPSDGEVQVNSESWNAVDIDGTSTQVEASAMNVTGDLDIGSNYDMGVPYTSGAPPIPDPLAWLPEPTWDPLTDKSPSPGERIEIYTGEYTFTPGYYSGGFYFGSSSDPNSPPPIIRFDPGVYILDGSSSGQIAGLVVYSGANVYANEAMFYITGDGIVQIQGTGQVQATEPTLATWEALGYPTVYEGVTIFQDRANTNSAYIRGTADLDLNGTLYFPSADPVNIRGGGWGFGNQLIGYAFDVRGQGIIGINYDGRNRAPITRAFLVE